MKAQQRRYGGDAKALDDQTDFITAATAFAHEMAMKLAEFADREADAGDSARAAEFFTLAAHAERFALTMCDASRNVTARVLRESAEALEANAARAAAEDSEP